MRALHLDLPEVRAVGEAGRGPAALALGVLLGSVVAAILISLLEAYASLWVSPSQAVIVSFVVLILTLLFRPTGLFAAAQK